MNKKRKMDRRLADHGTDLPATTGRLKPGWELEKSCVHDVIEKRVDYDVVDIVLGQPIVEMLEGWFRNALISMP